MRFLIFLSTGLLTALLFAPMRASFAQTRIELSEDARTATGFWLTQDHDGIIELYSCDNHLCGRIHWIKEDGPDAFAHDTHNPDPDRRNLPLCGLQLLGNFKPAGNGSFESGWIYSPHHGNTFNGSIQLIDERTLSLHGYFLLPWMGKSQTWTRVHNAQRCAR